MPPGHFPGCVDDFAAPAVVDRQPQGHLLVGRTGSDRPLEIGPASWGQFLDATDELQAYPEFIEFIALLRQVPGEKIEKKIDFIIGASTKILGGESKASHLLHPQIDAATGDRTEDLDALLVSMGPGKAPLASPAAVAIHDESDVTRQDRKLVGPGAQTVSPAVLRF